MHSMDPVHMLEGGRIGAGTIEIPVVVFSELIRTSSRRPVPRGSSHA
jgi:hypothetical protein